MPRPKRQRVHIERRKDGPRKATYVYRIPRTATRPGQARSLKLIDAGPLSAEEFADWAAERNYQVVSQ